MALESPTIHKIKQDAIECPQPEFIGAVHHPWRYWEAAEEKASRRPLLCNLCLSEIPQGRIRFAPNTLAAIAPDGSRVCGVSQVLHEIRQDITRDLVPQRVPQMLGGSVLMPHGNYWKDNYFHFVSALLPNLMIALEMGLDRKVDKILLPWFSRVAMQDIYQLIGLPKDKEIAVLHEDGWVQADQITLVSHTGRDSFLPPWKLAQLRKLKSLALAEWKTVEAPADVLVVRRGYGRGFTNEQEIIALAESRGFTVVDLDGWSLVDQVRLFARARRVIASHGSALTNVIFCPEGAQVLEIFSPYYVYDYFVYWALGAGLTYSYCVGQGPVMSSLCDGSFNQQMDVKIADIETWMNQTAP